MINWQVNDILRFRGGFNRATRAPNLGELFLNPQEIFGLGGAYGDACGVRSNSPYGAGGRNRSRDRPWRDAATTPLAPGQTAAGATSTRLICEALMGGAGSGAVNQYYNLNNAPLATGGGFAWVLQEGNEDLTSEVADTWTFGLVASLANNMTWSFDWYKVEIEDAIMLYSVTYAGYRCFGGATVTTPRRRPREPQRRHVSNVPRDQGNGNALNALLSYDNQATIKTSGMDIAWNWFKPIGSANLGFNLQATILDYYKTKQSPAPFDVETDWAGSLGPQPLGHQWRRVRLSAVRVGQLLSQRLERRLCVGAISRPRSARATQLSRRKKANNAAVAAGGPGILLSYTPTTEFESADYNMFDLSFGWDINDTLSFRGGITNLFDTEPEMVGGTTGYPVGTDLANVCEGLGFPNVAGHSVRGVAGLHGPAGLQLAGLRSVQPRLLRHARPSRLHRLEHAVLVSRFFETYRGGPHGPPLFFAPRAQRSDSATARCSRSIGNAFAAKSCSARSGFACVCAPYFSMASVCDAIIISTNLESNSSPERRASAAWCTCASEEGSAGIATLSGFSSASISAACAAWSVLSFAPYARTRGSWPR